MDLIFILFYIFFGGGHLAGMLKQTNNNIFDTLLAEVFYLVSSIP